MVYHLISQLYNLEIQHTSHTQCYSVKELCLLKDLGGKKTFSLPPTETRSYILMESEFESFDLKKSSLSIFFWNDIK